ncbi:glutathione S-transferase family protein [Pyruvatibacter mobilis]|uniref:glutathione S-transferase family protein n=1 Tax=Pyruvatibacter mobilis TaxID=1712261 RepID=UPI003C7AE0A5
MIIIHHLNNSRSQRILWLLEELGAEYEIKFYQRNEINRAPPELKQAHPLGKSPIIEDGNFKIAESGAAVDYLIRTHGGGKFMPAMGTDSYERYNEWMHYAEGSAMVPLLMKLFTSLLGEGGEPIQPIIDAEIDLHLGYMESQLGDNLFFVGDDLTGADIMLTFIVEAAESRIGLKNYPKLEAYAARMHDRPAYQRGLEKGGPYELIRTRKD